MKKEMRVHLKQGDKIDINQGYYTAPVAGIYEIDEDGIRLIERTCDFCTKEACKNPECFSKEEE